jgi:hypothetical protein
MPAKNLAQNETIEIRLSALWNGSVVIQSGGSANAGATFVVEVTGNEVDWVAIRIKDPTTAGFPDIANIVGPNKTAWADVPAFIAARAKRTDAAGGNGDCFFNFREM